jgi:diguanylate cyclase (GGDEF)-like protein
MLIAAACGTWLACDPLSPPRLPPLDARSLPLPLLLNWICLLLAAFAWTPALAQPEPGQPLSALEESSLQQSLEIEDRDWARPVEAAEKLSALVEVLPDASPLRRELLGLVGRLYVNADMFEAAEAVASGLDARQRLHADGSDLVASSIRLRLQSRRDGLAGVMAPLQAMAARVDTELSLRERLRYWYNVAGALASQAEFGDAVRAYQTADELADELGRPGWRSTVGSALAGVLSQLGQHERAVAMAREALAFARELGDDTLLADAYTTLGVVLEASGDAEGLLQSMQMAIEHARRADNGVGLSVLLGNVAHYHLVRRQFAEAERFSQEALDIAEQSEDTRGRALALANLGLSRIGLGRIEEGKALVAQSLEYDQLEGLRNEMALTHAELGAALEQAGDLDGAVQALHAARRLQDEIFREDQQRAVLAAQEKVAAQRREKEIQQLQAETARQIAEVERNRLQQWVWRLLSVLLVLALVLLVIGVRRLRASNRRLAGVNAQLRLQSERDPLTGLANRRHVQAVVQHAQGGRSFRGTLLLIDLDHFKQVNDRHGHAVGDALLVETARRLRALCRGEDLAARWGGEEFLLALDWLAPDDAEQLAARLLRELSQPIDVDGVRIPISASIGYAAIPLPPSALALPFEQALRLVDAGLYLAKLRGRHRACGITWIRESAAAKLEALIADIEHAEALGRVGLQFVIGEGDAA